MLLLRDAASSTAAHPGGAALRPASAFRGVCLLLDIAAHWPHARAAAFNLIVALVHGPTVVLQGAPSLSATLLGLDADERVAQAAQALLETRVW